MRCLPCFLSFLLSLFVAKAQPATDSIAINQLGFYPVAPKQAIIKAAVPDADFYLISVDKKDTVYTGKLGAVQASKNSSLQTRLADFSRFTQTGKYQLYIPSLGYSYPFSITADANQQAAIAAIKGFYYQRSDMPLDARFAGQWARAAGHADKQVLVHSSAATNQRPTGTVISTPGGWYDAGDYNKYIVNSGITMGTLLSAFEDFPLYFSDLTINIPESTNKIPDLLDEALYNLRWMLTMQDPADGGVYNKCTNADFDGMVMPGVTKLPRYVVQKSTAATLDFAAVMAQSARIFSSYKTALPGLSDSCLTAARTAWDWAQKNPAVEYNQDAMKRMNLKPAINTGGYGDKNFADEWFWAASELYITTKDENFFSLITRNENTLPTIPTWSNVHMLGVYSVARAAKQLPPAHAATYQSMMNKTLRLSNQYLAHIDENAFHTVMGQQKTDFNWGSNSNAANQGILLINAYLLTKDRKFANAAVSNLDYLLGRNATGYSFITGVGSKQVMHPHHRPSIADGITEPVPGLLAGGPNPGKQDGCVYPSAEPELAFSDTDCSYASNEIAINWNAPLVYLANAIEALQYELAYSFPVKLKALPAKKKK